MAIKIPELEVDGNLCQVYDPEAIHVDDLPSFLGQSAIREVIGELFFPVGSIYMTSSDTNPAILFGGEWARVEGRVIMGADANHPVNSEGGSEDPVIPSHAHRISIVTTDAGLHGHDVTGKTNEGGAHTHSMKELWSSGSGLELAYTMEGNRSKQVRSTSSAGEHYHTLQGAVAHDAGKHHHTVSGNTVGTGVTDISGKNNMPYVAYYIWQRTA